MTFFAPPNVNVNGMLLSVHHVPLASACAALALLAVAPPVATERTSTERRVRIGPFLSVPGARIKIPFTEFIGAGSCVSMLSMGFVDANGTEHERPALFWHHITVERLAPPRNPTWNGSLLVDVDYPHSPAATLLALPRGVGMYTSAPLVFHAQANDVRSAGPPVEVWFVASADVRAACARTVVVAVLSLDPFYSSPSNLTGVGPSLWYPGPNTVPVTHETRALWVTGRLRVGGELMGAYTHTHRVAEVHTEILLGRPDDAHTLLCTSTRPSHDGIFPLDTGVQCKRRHLRAGDEVTLACTARLPAWFAPAMIGYHCATYLHVLVAGRAADSYHMAPVAWGEGSP